MPLARINTTMLFFAHIPKTGGSSIEAYIAAKGQIALLSPRSRFWSKTNPQHMPEAVFRMFVPDAFYDHGFTVLRDPVTRMVSAYRMQIGGRHQWANPLNWGLYLWGRLRGRAVHAVPVWKFRLSLDFDTWVWVVTRVMARFRAYQYDGHLVKQADFVHPGHQIFLFEDGLDQVFRWIDDVTGTDPVPGDFHEMKPATAEVTCSPATERWLRRYYAEDYTLIADVRAGRVGRTDLVA